MQELYSQWELVWQMQEQTKETCETINIYDTKTRTDRSGTQNTKWGDKRLGNRN